MRGRAASRLGVGAALLGFVWLGAAGHAHAQQAGTPQSPATPLAAELFKDADLALGARLIAEHRCSECHVRKVGGDGTAVYRPKGRINTPGLLRGMVEQCNTELNLGMFPEEVSAVAAVLNRDHYRFK